MGTEAQKQHRANYAAKLDNVWKAGAAGKWTTDQQLRAYMDSQGIKGNPIYNQLYSKGGYATYGPSWDPTRTFDFEHNQNIMNMGPGETWYDPSVASNWQNTDPQQSGRMSGFFNWRDQNMDRGLNIDANYGGNALAAWLQGRAKSNRPNSPDMSWFNEGNGRQTLGSLAQRPGMPIRKPGQPIQTRPWASRPQTLGSLAFPSFPA